MTKRIEFNREKAAQAIFGTIATPISTVVPVSEVLYKDPRFNGPLTQLKYTFDIATRNCLLREGIERLGDLLILTDAELLRIPNFTTRCLHDVQRAIEPAGFCTGMKLKLAEQKPAVLPAKANTPAFETHDEFTTIGGQTLPAGAVALMQSPEQAEMLITAAKKFFGVADDYIFAIKRLPPRVTDKVRTYPVYFSDAALDGLSQPSPLKRFQAAYSQLINPNDTKVSRRGGRA